MKTRIITGAMMAVVFVLVLIFGQYFYIMPLSLALLGCVGAKEIISAQGNNCLDSRQMQIPLYIATALAPFAIYNKYLFLLIFFMYLTIFVIYVFSKENELVLFGTSFTLVLLLNLSMYAISYFYKQNIYYLVFFILLSSGTDIFAYFGGYFFGKNKLIPWVSPNKTIEGAIGGIVGAFGLSILGQLLAIHVFNIPVPESIQMQSNPLLWGATILILSVVSQFGDLFFSKIKRYFEAKDFGNLFPGHGGVLDRLDGVIFVTVTFLILSLVM